MKRIKSRMFLQNSPFLQVFNKTPSILCRDLKVRSPASAYGKVENLINTHLYRYFQDKREYKNNIDIINNDDNTNNKNNKIDMS